MERNLELDKKLAWQVFRIARDPDPRAAGSRIPGPSATRRLVQAAQKVQVTDGVCQRVEGAIQKCRGLIDEYAKDRSTFELMVSAVTGDGLDARNAELKRSAFRLNSQIFGRQCDTTVFSLIVMPGDQPGTVHLASVRGLEGLCSYRPLAGLEISRHRFDHASGEVQAHTPVEPSIRDDEPIALLRSFSTTPFPSIRQVRGSDGFARTVVETNELGHRESLTFYLSDVVRNSPLRGASGTEAAAVGHIYEVATPSSLLFHDVFIHESLAVPPEFRMLRNRRDAQSWPGEETLPLLPIPEEVVDLGLGAARVESAAIHSPELPRYSEMIEHVCAQLGWTAESLRLFRARIEYPVLDSVAWTRFDFDAQ